ncbi:Uncharacterized conserved protein YbjT, contains NAD(P)-binding and DUF2867 domains [Sphingomonas guangdongensis]|uniref:Uncharacterized conserved protein YbjT, contains NAD(P)-binding and DUF2867 domains n=1 Tax=Sphingomonas guangdongensis TaxID=1141890 RepID=A0A285QG30_9SPHN|nr:NmrA family NAD(P)-binding protein [Sphingomonas guangdongensis]SOB79087.1 Uncharacterized conserved protein YbjT, contains NAD(P)-binding and DUF2867 domains [Sphingomonas guangdongensis]
MIVVTGANGQLGQAVVDRLLNRLPAAHVAVSVRDPVGAAALASRGVEVRQGDFADQAAMTTAFAGADRVLIVSANALGEQALALHRTAIAAARAAGVGHVFYTSHMGARIGSAFAPTDQHARTEEALAASGIPYTALRHGFYAESCAMILKDALRTGELRVPEDGPVSWTGRDDLADADAALLAAAEVKKGPTPPLTSAVSVTMADVASLASEITGQRISHVTVDDAAWRDAKVAAGVPPRYADLQLGIFQAARAGDFAATDDALATTICRAPDTLRAVLTRELARAA